MVDARLRHFARLTDIAQRLRDSVEEREGEYIEAIDEWLDSRRSLSFELVVMPDGTLKVNLPMEEKPLFLGLRNHLSGDSKLWEALDSFKNDLIGRCRKRYDLSEAGVIDIDLTPVPSSWDTFRQLLELALEKGIATGQCEHCPDA